MLKQEVWIPARRPVRRQFVACKLTLLHNSNYQTRVNELKKEGPG